MLLAIYVQVLCAMIEYKCVRVAILAYTDSLIPNNQAA